MSRTVDISEVLPNNEIQAEIALRFFKAQAVRAGFVAKGSYAEPALVLKRKVSKNGAILTIKDVIDEINHRKKIFEISNELFMDVPRVFLNGKWYLIYANGNVASEQDPGYTIGRISLSNEEPDMTYTERVAIMLWGP